MSAKKRFFTRNKEKVGKKSGKARGKKITNPSLKGEILFEKENLKKPQLLPSGNSKQNEFPINYRSITEQFRYIWRTLFNEFSFGKGILIAFFLVLLGVSIWQAVNLGQSLMHMQSVLRERSKLSDDLKLWESITGKYPSYRDAYFQAGVLAYRLGDTKKETLYLGKTLELDPNFVPAQSLEKMGK